MIPETFVQMVMRRVTAIEPIPDKQDFAACTASAEDCLRWGFTVDDAVRFVRCLEHANPNLGETVALDRMRRLREKYGAQR